MSLAEFCEGPIFLLTKDRGEVVYRVDVLKSHEAYQHIAYQAALEQAAAQGTLPEGLIPELRDGRDVTIQKIEGGMVVVDRNGTSHYAQRLEETLEPQPFVILHEMGTLFRKSVYHDGKIDRLTPSTFDRTVLVFASHAYDALETIETARQRLHDAKSGTERMHYNSLIDQLEDSLTAFTLGFPSYAICLYGPDGELIVDEMDAELRGTIIGLRKEINCVTRDTAALQEYFKTFREALREHSF